MQRFSRITIQILVSGGLAWTVVILAMGSLTAVQASTLSARLSLQIGALGCPTNPSISFDPVNPQAGQSVEILGSVSTTGGGGPITFTWDLGDGSGVVTATPKVIHTYSLDDLYVVTLTATGQGCLSPPSVKRVIVVGFGPSATILFLPVILKNYPPFVFPTDTDISETAATTLLPTQVTGLDGWTDHVAGRTYLWWRPNPPAGTITGYHVHRGSQIGEGSFALLATVPAGMTTFSDTSAACGQIYYVTAFNAAGESSASTSGYYGPACR